MRGDGRRWPPGERQIDSGFKRGETLSEAGNAPANLAEVRPQPAKERNIDGDDGAANGEDGNQLKRHGIFLSASGKRPSGVHTLSPGSSGAPLLRSSCE